MIFPYRAIPSSLNPYFTTSDDRLVEYGIKSVLHDAKSSYQRVQIVETIDHGNLLILDGAVNLAENDTIPYTQALMNIPQDERNFFLLQETVENLKLAYVDEKERADHLATQMPL